MVVSIGRRTTRRAGGNFRPSRTKRGRKSGDDARSFSLDPKRPAKKWIEIMRSPAPTYSGFKVPVWVPLDDLTLQERQEYAPESIVEEPIQEEESSAPLGQYLAAAQGFAASPAAVAAPLFLAAAPAPAEPTHEPAYAAAPMDTSMTDFYSGTSASDPPVASSSAAPQAPSLVSIPNTPAAASAPEASSAIPPPAAVTAPPVQPAATPTAPQEAPVATAETPVALEEPPAKRVKISESPGTALVQQLEQPTPTPPQPEQQQQQPQPPPQP